MYNKTKERFLPNAPNKRRIICKTSDMTKWQNGNGSRESITKTLKQFPGILNECAICFFRSFVGCRFIYCISSASIHISSFDGLPDIFCSCYCCVGFFQSLFLSLSLSRQLRSLVALRCTFFFSFNVHCD